MAQVPTQGATLQPMPSRPTVSPYLNLTQPNTGALPAYHAFVLPMQQQQEFNQRQWANLRQLQTTQQTMQRSATMQSVRPTANRGRFQDYSHYYPNMTRR